MNPVSTFYYYKVFGLSLESSIPLEELIEIPAIQEPVIIIQFGKLTRPAPDKNSSIKHYRIISIKKEFFFMALKDIANYRVEQIQKKTIITIDVINEQANSTIMAFLYGSILTVALQMNNLFALHASAISNNGSLSLFSGKSGIGKSTLAAQLHTRGYGLFSDDKCVLNWSKDQACYLAEPSIQIIRLWQDALDNLDSTNFLGNRDDIIERVNKFQFQLDSSSIIKTSQKIKSINIIRNVSKDKVLQVKQALGMSKLRLLKEQTHRIAYLAGLEKLESHWTYIQHLAQQIPVNIILRPRDTPIHQFADFIENEIIHQNQIL